MSDDDEAPVPQQVHLAAPRPLSRQEMDLLRFVVEWLDVAELRQQCATAQVISTCSCGCPSIGLATSGPPVPRDVMRRLAGEDRDDWCEASVWGKNAQGRMVQVNLHLVDGFLHELEIWPGWDGGDPATDLPDVATLTTEPGR